MRAGDARDPGDARRFDFDDRRSVIREHRRGEGASERVRQIEHGEVVEG